MAKKKTIQQYEDLFEDLMTYWEIDPFQENFVENPRLLEREIRDQDRAMRSHGGKSRLSDSFLDRLVFFGYRRGLEQDDETFRMRVSRRSLSKRMGKPFFWTTDDKGNSVLVTKTFIETRDGKKRQFFIDRKGKFVTPQLKEGKDAEQREQIRQQKQGERLEEKEDKEQSEQDKEEN